MIKRNKLETSYMLRLLHSLIIFIFFLALSPCMGICQQIGVGHFQMDEYLRRRDLSKEGVDKLGWMLRTTTNSSGLVFFEQDTLTRQSKIFNYGFLPVFSTIGVNTKRPYVQNSPYTIIPAKGSDFYLSMGVYANFSVLNIQLQPEFVTSQNLNYQGFPNSFSEGITRSRFLFWNIGDSPERFGEDAYNKFFWGQSHISLKYGAFELGAGTRNYWWGPGQWNSLIFSNNAPGFPHLSLNTSKPAKTFLGHFEGQILMGKLFSSGFASSQDPEMNERYFRFLNPDWRYLNAFLLSYSPKWIPQLTLGLARTFQQYGEFLQPTFDGLFPIFEYFQKEKYFKGGNQFFEDYDTAENDRDQQAMFFGRFQSEKAKAEIYFEFGRRDHAFNWREFILNPEHARAYQIGFVKLIDLHASEKLLQVRGEITHQQESINIYLREGIFRGNSWHTHDSKRGFTNFGQPLGVGIGTGSNIQTLEISLVEDWKKFGILFQRLENHQDFYYRAFGLQKEHQPWIDWSAAMIWNASWSNLYFNVILQGVYAMNYQWGLGSNSSPDFPQGQNLFSVHSQVNLIYLFNKNQLIQKK